MKIKIVAVRDIKVEAFGQPQFVASIAAALRSFGDQVNDVASKSNLSLHPEDFELYELGEYDDATGLFVTGSPRPLALAVDLKR